MPKTLLENTVDSRSGVRLVVMAPDSVASYPLPPLGTFTIGRSEGVEIQVNDPMASRQHARLHIGTEGFRIEDLGATNRTKVRDVDLQPGQTVDVLPGEAIAIGSTILMLQTSGAVGRPRRIWPHDHFEARLEAECGRSESTHEPFAVVRLHVETDAPPMRVPELLFPTLRPPDMLAVYGPREFEVLLAGAPADLATALSEHMAARLRDNGIESRVGVACYPRDGRTPDALIGHSCARVLGPGADGAAEPSPVEPAGAMLRAMQLAARAATGNINVLIVGETGVGKEVMAVGIHRKSARAAKPFLCLNCAAFSEALLESELFGHEKGAFTGAGASKPGLLETAPGGTVFLDEIGEMPLGLQSKLLRVLESREVTRVGGLKPRAIDVRFVAATNRNLDLEIAEGRFRRDLYFRLNGLMLHIPPLRERVGEIAPLARLFAGEFARAMGQPGGPRISDEALALLERYVWPGNVRELRNVIERAVLLCAEGEISAEHLPVETMMAAVPAGSRTPPPSSAVIGAAASTDGTPGVAMTSAREPDSERERILRVLAECGGNQSRAARLLSISRSTLVAKLDGYQVPRPRKGGSL